MRRSSARRHRAFAAIVDALEARQLFSAGASTGPLVAPSDLDVTIGYREAPDGGTDRAHLVWTDTNTTETGYRVESSVDGLNNWAPIGADLPANSTSAAHVLNAGQKLYYRVSALAGPSISAPSNVDSPVTPFDRVVQVSATNSGDTITVRWALDPDAVSYKLYRKTRNSSTWSLLTPAPLAATSTGYTDSVAQGQAFEYQVERLTRNFYGTVDGTAYGYVYAGNRIASSDARGRVLLVVDRTQANAIGNELTRYRRDLLADGWTVEQITVDRDNGNAHQAADVKAQIDSIANAAPWDPLKSIVLIGHVPVPYSGTTAWDGHPDHNGAWPADGYYGEGVGTGGAGGAWTDTATATNLLHLDNNNIPFDGKFDQDTLPGNVTVPVGRIDFANTAGLRFSFSPPAPDAAAGETMALKRYFDKNHAWRTRGVIVSRTAIEDDHLGGAAAENGWRNFAPLVGAAATTSADWVTTMGDTSNLWSAGLGPGNSEYALGVVGVDQFHSADKGVYSVFNLLSGSWFGDWNKPSNLMREMIGANGTSLVAIWAGTPNVFLHTMGLGETIGQAMMLSQNNSVNGPYQPASSGARGTQMGLMGDPTLTMSIVAPVTNLSSSRTSNINSITWTTPIDTNVTGFNVYRADSPDGPFYRLNSSAIPTAGPNMNMTFADPSSIHSLKKFTYMVRTVKMQMTPSGRYENFSWGATVLSKITNGDGPEGPGQPGNVTTVGGTISTSIAARPARATPSIFNEGSIAKTATNPLDDLGL